MFVVIPLSKCLARPTLDGRKFLLVDHLRAVAQRCGSPAGSTNQRLGYLAGLLHDIGKGHPEWQAYIGNPIGDRTVACASRRKGPPHAPLGASIFTFVAEQLIDCWQNQHAGPKLESRQASRDLMLDWLMAIYGHHGRLGDFSGALIPWMKLSGKYGVAQLFQGLDHNGLSGLISAPFSEFTADWEKFPKWLDSFERSWLRLVEIHRKRIVETCVPSQHAMRYPQTFATLIAADRIDAGEVPAGFLSEEAVSNAIKTLQIYCEQQGVEAGSNGGDQRLIAARQQAQAIALSRFRAIPDQKIYTLPLPTGYGKTLTAVRVALEACQLSRRRRIIYVAPYLSILSQASHVLARATGIDVVQHHHLSRFRLDESSEHSPVLSPSQAGTRVALGDPLDDDDDFDPTDTWKLPVLATTFNQLFRALFPQRAQQSLRIDAVRQAFVIIDEPQIIDTTVWRLFTEALKVFADQHDCQVLFASATLPRIELGESVKPVVLADQIPVSSRYEILILREAYNQRKLVDGVLQEFRNKDAPPAAKSAAVVMNTVREAAELFRELRAAAPEDLSVKCLTAMMLAAHKQEVIEEIARRLAKAGSKKISSAQRGGTLVVCTQILEAGVDLSFQNIWRGLPILPSIAQVAGRANRHGGQQLAKVRVFRYQGSERGELRHFVYRDVTARMVTDQILESRDRIEEAEIPSLLEAYYEECLSGNAQQARLEDFRLASLGQWSRLGTVEPFGISAPRDEMFVPLEEEQCPRSLRKTLAKLFGGTCHQLIERWLDEGNRSRLHFREKQQQGYLVQQFMVPAPRSVCQRYGVPLAEGVWKLANPADYDQHLGLAGCLLSEDEDASTGTMLL